MPRGSSYDDLPGFTPASEHQRWSPPTPKRASPSEKKSAPPPPPTARVPLDQVKFHPKFLEVIRGLGIVDLYPPQAEALVPVLEGKSVVLCCPTSAGKSLVAYAALVGAALEGRRGIYIVPLRALASEKSRDLKAFESLGLKVGLTMGERDLSSEQLEKIDILVATSEKTDSLLRHRSPWMEQVGVVVADEVHLMRDPTRGPTLEVSLTRLRRRHRGLQVVALSATVGNAPEVARWLGATLVQSEFRPVKLRTGVYRDGTIRFVEGPEREVPDAGTPLNSLVEDILREGGQALVFVNSRKSTTTGASKLVESVDPSLTSAEKADLSQLSKQLAGDVEEETEALKQLAVLVRHGIAFHHAGLSNDERAKIEDAFRARRLKCLVATTTLAAGLNLPARRVIVRDTTRYDDSVGMSVKIPAGEVQQMLGRAGRPRLDPYGEAVLLGKDADDEEDLVDRYLTAPPEDVESQLGSVPVLRTHLLALVASEEVTGEGELQKFLEATFHGANHSFQELRNELSRARHFLVEQGLLEKGSRLKATPFGKLASDLYLDPVSAVLLRRGVLRAEVDTPAFPFLATIALTPDLLPLTVRTAEEEEVLTRFRSSERELLIPPEDDELVPPLLEGFLPAFRAAMLLEAWTDDRLRLLEITEAFRVGAGDLRSRVERAEWLLSSMAFLAKREDRRQVAVHLDQLALRVRYGVRPELLELVSLRGVGRVRSRILYERGWKNPEELARVEESDLARALTSPVLAKQLLDQVRRRHHLPGPVG